jgi:hypothetical protein
VIFEISVVRERKDMDTIKLNTKLYQDYGMKIPWDNGYEFYVEIKGDKARVKSTAFSLQDFSRFTKLTCLASWTGGKEPGRYQYQFTVNGQKAFMIIEHKI